jgi:hypothetical protein
MGRAYEPEDISPKQTELATSLRIPFINNPYPRWYYVTAIVVSTDPRLWRGLMPTDDEVRVVASFNDEYRQYFYNEWWKGRMREFAPYDIDGGAVGRYLIKHANGGWGYRRSTWQYGPEFVPTWSSEPEDLVSVLDRCQGFGSEPNPRWEQWKADHPDVFQAVTS